MTKSRTPAGAGQPSLPLPNRELLERLGQIAHRLGTRSFLVGGPVRDLILGRPNSRTETGVHHKDTKTLSSPESGTLVTWCLGGSKSDSARGTDIDVAVEEGSREFGAAVAKEFDGRFVYHARFFSGSVQLLPTPDSPLPSHLDITQTRAETYERPAVLPAVRPASIVGDLGRRDFTINAMACRLGRAIRGNRFMMNPLFFIGDIDARVIRIMNIFTFRSDPILGFRAVRLATTHGFIIHPDTIEVMKGMRDIVRYGRARQMHRELLLIMLAPNIGIGWVYLQQVGWLSNIPKSLFEKQKSIMSKISDILAIQPIHGVILSHKEFDNAFGWYQSRLQGSIARGHENGEI